MSVQELRDETQGRGLGTARSKADLIQRLTDHDAAQPPATPAAPEAPADNAEADEAVLPAEPADAPAGPRSFRQEFPAEPGGPDEETHLAQREATLQAAQDAGHVTRGDARLVSTTGGRWVYEILIRRVT